jgi:hypothetical protein
MHIDHRHTITLVHLMPRCEIAKRRADVAEVAAFEQLARDPSPPERVSLARSAMADHLAGSRLYHGRRVPA